MTPSFSSRHSKVTALMALPLASLENQQVLAPLADALPESGPPHLIGGDGLGFSLSYIPGKDLEVPDGDHLVEV